MLIFSLPCGCPNITDASLSAYSQALRAQLRYRVVLIRIPRLCLLSRSTSCIHAVVLNKTQSAVHGGLPLCWQCSANLRGGWVKREDQKKKRTALSVLLLLYKRSVIELYTLVLYGNFWFEFSKRNKY
jgi:hypothetical protein